MDYIKFQMQIEKSVSNALGENVQVEIQYFTKNNGIIMEGMVFTQEGYAASPIIYLEEYYDLWRKGVSLEQLTDKIVWEYNHYVGKIKIQKDFFCNYEEMKESIFYKLVNYERNKELLKDIPHKRFLDLAVVFYYCVEGQEPMGMIQIHNHHLESWHVTLQQLAENAFHYTYTNNPPEFLTMRQIFQEYDGIEIPEQESNDMYILTNEERYLGAGVILYPGVLKQAEDLLGENFYILPSSIHECILVADTVVYSKNELTEMVTEINREQLDPREILSDRAYYYRKEDGKIQI